MSKYLADLEQELRSCDTLPRRYSLLGNLGIYHARLGHSGDVDSVLALLRSKEVVHADPVATVWAILVEGVNGLFTGNNKGSWDRLRRVHVLAGSSKLVEVQLLAAAWLAHMEFNRGRYDQMLSAIASCGSSTWSSSREPYIRLCLTLGLSHHYSGNYENSRQWYGRCHQLASSLGDEATIAAIIYNRAAFNLARARIAEALDVQDEVATNFLKLEISSAASFHHAAGHTSLGQLITVLRARGLIISGDYSAAASLLSEVLGSGQPTTFAGEDRLLMAELAECLAHAGSRGEALRLCDALRQERSSELGIDDALILNLKLRKLRDLLGDEVVDVSTLDSPEFARMKYFEEIASLQQALVSVEQHLATSEAN